MQMKTKILIILIILITLGVGGFFLYSSIPQQVHNKDVSGILVRNQIWSGQINVIGDILVMPWVTLTILPGTTVIVSANKDTNNLFGRETCDGIKNYDMLIGIKREDTYTCGVHLNEPYRDEKNHISIAILGTLKAVGTEENRIVFRSNSQNPTMYDWNSFGIRNGILSYANLENYRVIDTAGDVEISHNNLKNIGECGICANSDKAKILFNTISYAGHELIDMHNSSPVIRQNNLGPNPDYSCITIDGGSPQVTGNIIEGCGSAISLLVSPSDPKFEDSLRKENTFLNNMNDIWYNY